MRFELERGHIDDFAKLLDEHWKLTKMIDAGSTNTLIDQIFAAVDEFSEGRLVCGVPKTFFKAAAHKQCSGFLIS